MNLPRPLIPFLLLAAASSALAAPVVLDRLEASVNSALILQSDVEKFRKTESLRSQLDPLFAGTTVATHGKNATASEIVEFLIDEKIISAQFPVSDTETEQEINSIQAGNHMDRAQLKGLLSEQGFGFDEYFELIRSSTSKRNLIDRDIRTKVSISEDDVKNYFYNHYAQGSTPLAYHLQIITVSSKNFKTAAAAKEVAQRALTEIKSGEPFDEVAKRSSDSDTAATGGDLGTLTEDQMSPAIREQVRKLKIGQVSEVFAGPGAFYIIKMLDMKSSASERLDKMKDEIRNQLVAAEFQHQIQLWLERQRQSAFIHRAGEPTARSIPKT